MRAKKVANSDHGPRHVTPAGRSVFYDLFPAEKSGRAGNARATTDGFGAMAGK
jgi:hypothetical protein